MNIQFDCEHCQKLLQLPADARGKSCRCPNCGHVMTVPDDDSPAADSAPDSPYADPIVDSSASADPLRNPYAPSAAPGGMIARPHRGSLILLLGILSIFFGLFSFACCMLTFPFGIGFGIPAFMMGKNDLLAIQQHQMDPAGESQTRAGMICGIVGSIAASLSILMTIVMVMLSLA